MNKPTWQIDFEQKFPHWQVGQECMQDLPTEHNVLDFITSLLTEVVSEIPSDTDMNNMDFPFQGIDNFKQELKEKYGLK